MKATLQLGEKNWRRKKVIVAHLNELEKVGLVESYGALSKVKTPVKVK
ncbi:MAG: hypothetical protein ACTHKP_07615 [Nitrososphaeraceae archaeon]